MSNVQYSDSHTKCSMLVFIIFTYITELKVFDYDFLSASLKIWVWCLTISKKIIIPVLVKLYFFFKAYVEVRRALNIKAKLVPI